MHGTMAPKLKPHHECTAAGVAMACEKRSRTNA